MFDAIELWFQSDSGRVLIWILIGGFLGGWIGKVDGKHEDKHEVLKKEVEDLKGEVEVLKRKTRHVD